MKRFIIILFCSFCFHSGAQNIIGNVSQSGQNIEGVTVSVIGGSIGTSTNKEGNYILAVSANRKQTIAFSYLGYKTQKVEIPMLKKGQNYTLNIEITPLYVNIENINVKDEEVRNNTFDKLDSKHINILPNSSGGVEGIIKTLPGVSSSTNLALNTMFVVVILMKT